MFRSSASPIDLNKETSVFISHKSRITSFGSCLADKTVKRENNRKLKEIFNNFIFGKDANYVKTIWGKIPEIILVFSFQFIYPTVNANKRFQNHFNQIKYMQNFPNKIRNQLQKSVFLLFTTKVLRH